MNEKRVTAVAVIGMACRLPGGIDSPQLLWEALLRGDDLITEVPPDRWDADEYYDPEPGVPGRSVCKWGAFLDNVADFDPEFFGITEKEATAMDPQHRLLLETSWEAMEHGGFTREKLADLRTGVFVGLMHDDYQFVHADAEALEGPYGYMGNSFAMGSGRIAYAMGLHGPAMTVDTACSSGLAAIHLACRSLHDGESDVVLAGGASVMFEPRKTASGSAIGMLSPTGRCHAFDVAADGFVAGEGCVVVLLKRLPDALADGDRILAVIRGTAANQDGHTVNIVTPSGPAQVAAYRAALAAADVDPRSVGMVEAHGPGTPVGDPIEYASLAEVYGVDGPCALASVKTNFGHTQSAAGALGLMKAVLAVQHGVIPRNLHFTRLPDEFAQIETNLFVPQTTTPWPSKNGHPGPRRAAVSSYGFSGTNVHAIVEQAPAAVAPDDVPTAPAIEAPLLFPLSATSADGLRQTAGRMADWIEAHESDLTASDLAYTLTRRRGHRPVRTAAIAGSVGELTDSLREIADGEFPYPAAVGQDDRGPVWVFSGQGSQWAAMGAELLATEPVFAATVAEAEPLIAKESGFSVTEAISAPETVTGIDRIQPALFTMQVALAATMRSYGVQPGAVIGHSMGEAAAAVVAGALALEDGVRVICRRSRLMSTIAGSGAMASVELPAQQVLSELMARGVNEDVVVAVVASPQSTVIGGAAETVRGLVAAWEERDVMAREVAVDVASHTPQVDPILDELTDVLAELNPMTPEIPFYSTTLFDPRDEAECDAWYWADNLRHMVRFAVAVQAALEDGYRVFAELAPHPLLTHAIEQTARNLGMPLAAIAAMRREQQVPHGLRGLLADLYSAGAAIDFSVLYPNGRLMDAPLPTWSHRPLLLARDGQDSRTRDACRVAVHPLMGAHVRLQEEPERHVWQGEVGTAAQPWLGDHQIHHVAVLPAAVHCEMALAAARTVLGEGSEVRDIRFEQMLLVDEETPVGAVASVEAPGGVTFSVESYNDGQRDQFATAVLVAQEDEDQSPEYDVLALLAAHPRRLEGTDLRKWFDRQGFQYGPAFTGLAAAHTAEGPVDTVLAEVGLPGPLRSQQNAYGIHPALLDACFQSVAAAFPDIQGRATGGMLAPLGVSRLCAYGSTRNARYCFTRVTRADTAGVDADLNVLDENGTVLLAVRGLQMGVTQGSEGDRVLGERLLTIEWQERTLPDVDQVGPGSWLLVSTSTTADVVATRLTDALKSEGAACTTMTWPQHSDHQANAELLGSHLGGDAISGVIVLTGAKNGNPDEECALRGANYVQHLVRIASTITESSAEPPRLYLVTRNAQTVLPGDVANLEQAGLRGLVRVISAEYPHLRASQIDMDGDTEAELLARQLLGGSEEDETAWRKGQWHTARLSPAPLRPEERRTAMVDHAHEGMRLQIRTPGDLETMELAAFDRVPPGPGEIEVAVTASSINFADVLIAFGRYPTIGGAAPGLGMDFAGVVTAVGPDVTTHRVGDHVGGFSKNGCWATFVSCDARLAATLPPGLTDDQAAAVSTAHAIAWYGLHEQARITAGDRVLIHSATGGVGQAAIAIARAAGAEIFATAGSEQRRALLRDMGIEHVYDSRSTEFAEQIRRDTDGYGVDIVLNSLTGAAQRAGLELLSIGGRFVEIGKRDVYANTRLGLFPFHRNLTFHYVDLALMSESHPKRIGDLLGTVYRLVADGELPLPESTHYPLRDAAAAVRTMTAEEHTGKLVLDVPHHGHSNVVVPPERARVFRCDGSYIITGGLGGLGLFLAEKMAAGGCGRIVLNSRSQPNPKALQTIELIRAIGADIEVECGDIAETGTAERLVRVATATGLPLRGVLHAATALEDATLTNLTAELIDRNWAAKVYGLWNLHQATATLPLDWFCSFSSVVALVGSAGQCAYAAANSWLDAFSRWRQTQGLPATTIAWALWAEMGAAAALRADIGDAVASGDGADGTVVAAHWRNSTVTPIAPDEGAYAFEALLRHSRPYTGYAPIRETPWLTAFAQRSRFAELFQSTGQTTTDTCMLRDELNALPPEEWPTRLRRLVSDQVSLILRRAIDPDRPLSEYGLDSLGNLELRTHIKAETGIRVTSADITTVQGLAGLLSEKLASSQAAPAPS